MIVTGTRIQRTSFAPAAPVEVIGRRQLEQSNARNLSDAIRYLTANSSSDLLGTFQAAYGTTSVNLRGLGPSATLVLVNGRRIMPTAAGFGAVFYDLNAIPLAAVERLEVLRGGASSIYGSDAVAGVINIITRRDWNGFRAELGGEVDDTLTYHDRDVTAAVGGRGERHRVSLGVSHVYRSRLLASDRDFTDGTTLDVLGNPAAFYVPSQMGLVPDSSCNDVEGSATNEQGLCTYDFADQSDLIPERETLAAFGTAEYDVTLHTTFFTEVAYSRTRVQQTITPSLGVLPQVTVPAEHVDNPFGEDVFYVGRVLPASAGNKFTTTHDDSFRALLGLRGDFEGAAADTVLEDFTWEVSASYGVDLFGGHLPAEVIVENLREALEACSDRSDLSRCFNPFYTAYTGEGTPNSQAVIDHLLGRLIWSSESALTTFDAGITGSLFELPGGEVKLALGGQYRSESRITQGDHDASELGYGFFFGFDQFDAQRSVTSAYLELLWPLLDGVELQTAGRVEHHEAVATSVSPSAGLVLTPSELIGREQTAPALRDLRVRGQITRAFRAPSLFEAYPSFTTAILQFEENGIPLYRAAIAHGNPELEPESALVVTSGLEWAPLSQLALSAEYWIYDYRDKISAENAVQIHANDPNDPRVRRDDTGGLIGVDVGIENSGTVLTDGLDLGASVNVELASQSTLTAGVQASYVLRYEIDRAQIANITLEDGTAVPTADCDADHCSVAGLRNYTNFVGPIPRLRLNVPIVFAHYAHTTTVIAHVIGSLDDDQDPDLETGALPEIPAYFTLDLQYAYMLSDVIGESTTLRVGVLNLFDAEPPGVKSAWGFEARLHDPRGRMLYARVIQQF